MQKKETFTATADDEGARLDVFLSDRMPGRTRSSIKGLIENGLVTVDFSRASKAGLRLRSGETVSVVLPPEVDASLTAEAIDLDVLYEDSSIIVVNKPRGMSVHPGAGDKTGTLAAALLHRCKNGLSTVGGAERPGIVHRLDKDTTGVMVAAKTNAAHASLAAQFKAHETDRAYTALVWGKVEDDGGVIELPIGRSATHRKKISTRTSSPRHAVTRFSVVARFGSVTLVELRPKTGRTHQIRVHLAAIGHPVVGDPLYGKRSIPPGLAKPVMDMIKGLKGQCLHAASLAIKHPVTGVVMEFKAPCPEPMAALITELKRQCS